MSQLHQAGYGGILLRRDVSLSLADTILLEIASVIVRHTRIEKIVPGKFEGMAYAVHRAENSACGWPLEGN